jgi:uncharacterized secreted protein with C-terminal beta-propeller domain
MKYLKILLIIISLILLFSGCKTEDEAMQKDEDNITIHSDTEFIAEEFPELSGVKVARYYYEAIEDDNSRFDSLGPAPVRFAGLIYLQESAATDIANGYNDWSACNVQLPGVLSDGNTYAFFFSEEFGEIFSASFVGYFYFDKEAGVLFFEGEY